MVTYDEGKLNTPLLRPKISVIGVGGAGGNMLNVIIDEYIDHVDFVAINTDAQALDTVLVDKKIVLGKELIGGLGTGANPEIGKIALEENVDLVMNEVGDSDIVFLIGGLGGGTGSGVIPYLAKDLQDRQILTISIITKPFFFEGSKRMHIAQQALSKIEEYSDNVIIIPNQKLFECDSIQTISLCDAFNKINKVIVNSIKAVVETIFSPGNINIDFADVKSIMTKMGRTVIGIGSGEGDNRAIDAIQNAINSPLLENNSLKGARSILLNIEGDETLSLYEMNIIAGFIHDEAHPEAHIIVGSTIKNSKDSKKLTVTIIVTGFEDQLKTRIQNKNTIYQNTSFNSFNNYQNIKKNQHFGISGEANSNQLKMQESGMAESTLNNKKDDFFKNDFNTQKVKFSPNLDIPTYLRNRSAE